jgi:hypothetical protein
MWLKDCHWARAIVEMVKQKRVSEDDVDEIECPICEGAQEETLIFHPHKPTQGGGHFGDRELFVLECE